jgi:hypothetical protein
VVIVLLPLLGTFIYFVARPKEEGLARDSVYATRVDSMAAERADTQAWQYQGGAASSADQLRTLADLADRGRISDEEYQAEKARILGSQRQVAPGAPASSAPA